jgi:formylglycine-generating enzyme required for sulfatase activity
MRLNFRRVELDWNRAWPIVDWNDRGPTIYDWTWSPNLVYNMHTAESWGRVILSDRTVLQGSDPLLDKAFPFVEPPQKKMAPQPGRMVLIKGGTYPVGPDPSDPKESPEGTVSVQDFFIDCYEVTIGEYIAFLNSGEQDRFYEFDMGNPDFCGIVKRSDGRYVAVPGKELYPVTLVKYEGAEAYAAWAGKRLPTEFEWEIAARGGSGRRYPWGNSAPDASHANFDYMAGHPTPVGSYEQGKTPEGVYDLCGNVWEMCSDTWKPYAWRGASGEPRTSGRIIRGGSWVTPPLNLSASYRNGNKGEWSAMVGFRCARDGKAKR